MTLELLKTLGRNASERPWRCTPYLEIFDSKKEKRLFYGHDRNDVQFVVEMRNKLPELIAELDALRDGAELHLRKGHNDTCSKALIETEDCDCGHAIFQAVFESQFWEEHRQ